MRNGSLVSICLVAMNPLKVALVAVILVAMVAMVLFQRKAGEELRARDQAVVSLDDRVKKLEAENEWLSARAPVTTPKTDPPTNSVAASAWIRLGRAVEQQGLFSANQHHDGVTEPDTAGGVECHALQRHPGRPELYAYFKIDPAFKRPDANSVIVEVEYFDADAGGHFRLDYDSYDELSRSGGAYTQSKERVNLKGTERWRKARFLLDDGRFEGRENDGSDFRVTVVGARFFLRSVKLMRE
jgi:hypothetical protein